MLVCAIKSLSGWQHIHAIKVTTNNIAIPTEIKDMLN